MLYTNKKQKTIAHFVKKRGKKPNDFSETLLKEVILRQEMNVTCKKDESIQLIHLWLCKLNVRHIHTEYF